MCTYTVSPLRFRAQSKLIIFSLPPPLSPKTAGSIYCDPRAGASLCIVSLFAFSGPGRKVKLVIFPFPPPFAPKNFVEYLLPLSRGGEKLDGVSSTSLQGVGLGPLGISPSFLVDFALACCVSPFVQGGMTVQFPKRLSCDIV